MTRREKRRTIILLALCLSIIIFIMTGLGGVHAERGDEKTELLMQQETETAAVAVEEEPEYEYSTDRSDDRAVSVSRPDDMDGNCDAAQRSPGGRSVEGLPEEEEIAYEEVIGVAYSWNPDPEPAPETKEEL